MGYGFTVDNFLSCKRRKVFKLPSNILNVKIIVFVYLDTGYVIIRSAEEEIIFRKRKRKVIDSLREMIKTYEEKIKRAIDRVWGE